MVFETNLFVPILLLLVAAVVENGVDSPALVRTAAPPSAPAPTLAPAAAPAPARASAPAPDVGLGAVVILLVERD